MIHQGTKADPKISSIVSAKIEKGIKKSQSSNLGIL
jgi:hypothetical protein